MSERDPHFDEFDDVIERLQAARPEASPLELDRMKTTAMARAKRHQASPAARRTSMRRTLVVAMVTGSLMIGGTGAVLAGGHNDGDNDQDDAGKGQYPCPPGTHGKSCKPCPNDHQGKSHKNGNRDCSPGPKPGSHGSNGSHGNGNQSHSGGSHQSH
jgi:hypothetical protein